MKIVHFFACLHIAVTLLGCWEFKLKERDTDALSQFDGTDEVSSDKDTQTDEQEPQPSDIESETEQPSENPCDGVVCNAPGSDSCDSEDNTKVKRRSREGYCIAKDGKPICEYATFTDTCIVGTCEQGQCTQDPLRGKFCFDPPSPTCDNDQLIVHYPHGVVVRNGNNGEIMCDYLKEVIDCPRGCDAKKRQCAEDPCLGVTCNNPPARYCDNHILVKWEHQGRCGDDGKCIYDKRRIYCENGCENGTCKEDLSCRHTICAKPPANYCIDDINLYAYFARGDCEEGACIYSGKKNQMPVRRRSLSRRIKPV